MSPETDDTVRLNGPRRGERPRLARAWPYAAGAVLAAGLAAGGAWWSLRPPAAQPQTETLALPAAPQATTPPAPIQQAFAPAPVPPPPYAPPLVNEAEVLAASPEQMQVYRFAPYPAIVILQFPSLSEQGSMLNRVAALVEKAGFPHDRVLAPDELDARIRAAGLTPETFYYGHDYRAGDVARFFTLTTELNDFELRLQDISAKLGWQQQGAVGALVTLVRETPRSDLDAAARATILRHELAHGVYFTDPAYAEYVHQFWNEVLTAEERTAFATYLRREGYDPALIDLIVNETQAYLIHTTDRRFFRPTEVGLSEDRAAELRRIFLAGMPAGWLRDAASALAPPVPPRTP